MESAAAAAAAAAALLQVCSCSWLRELMPACRLAVKYQNLLMLLLLQVCQMLLARGADASLADAEGQLPQQVAPATWSCWKQ
jgi:hypothetical protein